MIPRRFSDFDREELHEIFGLKRIRPFPILEQWIAQAKNFPEIPYADFVERLQQKLIDRVDYWNEWELIQYFIAPIISIVNFDTEYFHLFSQHLIKATVGEYELSGEPDMVIARGDKNPKNPYFCFHEYKKENEPKGDPAAQVLVAMLAAQELDQHQNPIYGIYIAGRNWYFLVLHEKEYGITTGHNSADEGIYDIIRILEALKAILIEIATPKIIPT